MQELELRYTEAEFNVINKDEFEKGVKDVVEKYKGYTVTASTFKEDKQTLAKLRKLLKQISDKRIEIKRDFTKPLTDFENYLKNTVNPVNEIVDEIAKGIKEVEEHQKTLRLDTIKVYIANRASEYMLDPRIFNEKASEYVKAGNFMSDGFTLKKAAMKELDDLITFEYQKQQEINKAKSVIATQCEEYNMTDLTYIRMLDTMTLADILEQIKQDYEVEKQKREKRKIQEERRRAEEEKRKVLALQKAAAEEKEFSVDVETGEIEEVEPKIYTQEMTIELYLKNTEEKDYFKETLKKAGFYQGLNYNVKGYHRIKPLSQTELNNKKGWLRND